jgi:hypothetical protein
MRPGASSGASACASGVDTEHLFGFSEGADAGKKGERELESKTIACAGKAAGKYGAASKGPSRDRAAPTPRPD